MLEIVIDRLAGIDKNRLNDALLELVISAEKLGLSSKKFLYEHGTRDELIASQEQWQKDIDAFYETYVK